ncbi:MAG: hypothetical protein IJH81_10390, partial [Lachnospiraceae bacterium]|nr:hypothetical protein [Lachnospiraceae bacterium]
HRKMSVKVRTKGAEKAGWQRSLASRTPKSIILGAVAWLNFSANATAPFLFLFMIRSVQCIFPPCGGHGLCKLFFRHAADTGRSGAEGGAAASTLKKEYQ